MEAHITREYIRNFFKLGESSQEQAFLNAIITHLISQKLSAGSYVCRMGEQADAMYFIESGRLQVRGRNRELINELKPGQYFGEYAALTGETRMADVLAVSDAAVYRLDSKILQTLFRNNPKLYSVFLKNAYDEATNQYRKLVKALNRKRGIGAMSGARKASPLKLFVNYYLVFFVFLVLILLCPNPKRTPLHPLLLASPMVFLVVYIAVTRRALEALVLSVLYLSIMLARYNFIGAFCKHLVDAITGTPDIIVMVFLMGVLTRLFSFSGSINALKDAAQKHISTGKGTMLTVFFATIFLAIEEYLCIIIHSACFRPIADDQNIPREKSSMIMGMTPGAFCMLNPLSLTGIYIAGIIFKVNGERSLFIKSIIFNFGAILTLGFIILLALEKAPLAGSLKKAVIRVKEGGAIWPDEAEEEEPQEIVGQGRISNLVLPILVLIASSIITGTLESGIVSVNVLYGLIITLIFSFFLYCFQEYMTPDQFFRHIIHGIEGMLAPIVMFILGTAFAVGMEEIGFPEWLNGMVGKIIGGQGWMLPALVFGICTLIGALFDNPWAMYALGIPVALELADSMQGNLGLYMGAVCAAGLLGNEIAFGDIFFIGPTLGISPMVYYRAKLPYVVLISALAFLGYLAAGFFLQ
ncbi:MAG: cyclic nucleotide-binding domain-containing protein [Spirochaetales bacterium]|jgi:Na+/H+ antiporter NhaC|nr:cyclic nucleotide-binding domain-containing protein [Spirochaetales bacterium]